MVCVIGLANFCVGGTSLFLSFFVTLFLFSTYASSARRYLCSPGIFSANGLLDGEIGRRFLGFSCPAKVIPVLFTMSDVRTVRVKTCTSRYFGSLMSSVSRSESFGREKVLILISGGPGLVRVHLNGQCQICYGVAKTASKLSCLSLRGRVRRENMRRALPLFLRGASIHVRRLGRLPSCGGCQVGSTVSMVSAYLRCVKAPSRGFCKGYILAPVLGVASFKCCVFGS